jgi:bleomycin hydrolase
MKHFKLPLLLIVSGWLISGSCLIAQEKEIPETDPPYQFTVEFSHPATSVKDQHRTGTCWSFATTSFIESELLRTGKGEYDLSEMYIVRKAYELKAKKYVRMHGSTQFGNGGLAMDVMHIWKESGMVPQEAYDGMIQGDSLPVHGEMDAVLKGYIDQVIKNPNRTLTPVWHKGFRGILDAYLGPEPGEFDYHGEKYTPQEFGASLGLNPDDYVAIGSYLHHPNYEEFIIEIPDNWLWGSVQNVPLDEMMEILDHALESGFTVCWDTDTNEKGYEWKKGVARLPNSEGKEQTVTQEIRQMAFDNYQTTDVHLMHITGIARDQDGNKYYRVKNSWGGEEHIFQGYLYASEAYIKAKTIFFMVHKDAIPSSLGDKLNL